MTRQRPNSRFQAIRAAAIASAVGLSTILVLPITADAQQRYLGSTSSVVIDLSVLDDVATLGGGQVAPGTSGTVTLLPPARPPVSRLEGPLANRSITLTQPTSRPARVAAATPPPASAPTPAPQPTVVQIPPPAPATPPAPAATPPAAAPAPPAATASTPPPPAIPAGPEVAPPPPPAAPAASDRAPASAPPPTQTAARTDAPADGDETRVLFEPGSANLSDAAKASLNTLASQLKADSEVRVQLQAYAAGTDESAPDARRLSLSRALKVRSHLIDQGVRSTRMDVRALGVKAEGGPSDRVDAVIFRR
ncbi:MAG: hypothetical protein CL566_02245 [Alphaproteobacteria bacterium]|nr:hypothetical protein [Alphaproteobacteria bacterium]